MENFIDAVVLMMMMIVGLMGLAGATLFIATVIYYVGKNMIFGMDVDLGDVYHHNGKRDY